MSSRQRSRFFVVLVLIIAGVVVGGYFIFRPTSTKTPTENTGNAGSSRTITGQSSYINTSDFRYPEPQGWAKLSKTVLDSEAANSGIGLVGKPVFFTTQVSSSAPSTQTEFNTSILNIINKLPGFKLLSSGKITVGGQPSQQFTYTFNGSSQLTIRGQMIGVVHNKKTLFLQFLANDNAFDSHQADFNKILAGFQFK